MISIRQHRGSEKSAAAASSAELSEAINSMYRWYEQARVGMYTLLMLVSGHPSDASSPFHDVF